MTARLLSKQFPTETNYGLNFFDQTPTNGGADPVNNLTPGWSGGAQLVTTIQQPSTVDKWTVQGWGVAFQGALTMIAVAGVPMFARLPKLYGGLVRNSGRGDGIPHSFQGLPSDASLIELLWDGTTDPPFPQALSSSPFSPGAASMSQRSVVLPDPIELDSGESLEIGFWLTPMLGQNVRVWVFAATYTVMYDPTT